MGILSLFSMKVCGYLGVSSNIGQKIVDAIDWGAAAFVLVSILATVMSAGAAGALSASMDFVILTVKNYIKRDLKAQAVVW